MSNLSELQAALTNVLADNLADVQVSSQYPPGNSPIPKGKAFVAVGTKQFEENDDSSTQKINAVVYVPFYMGSDQCVSYMDKIIELTRNAGLKDLSSITAGEVNYNNTYEYFNMTMTVTLSVEPGTVTDVDPDEEEETQTISFGGIELICMAKNIKLVCSRQLGKKFSPFVGEIIQDLGIKSKVITCTCDLSVTQYQAMQALFSGGEKNALKIPHNEEIKALLTTMTGNYFSDDLITCQFIFTEVSI